MKKIFKLLPVALGLVALASCSSDDLFEGNAATPDVASAITGQAKNVGVEEFGSTTTTRSAIVTKNNGKHATMWNTSDKFRVYDTDLSKYDTYTYNATSSAFTKEGTKRVTGSDIAWALFPADRVSWTSYDEATGAVKVIFTIKDNITYDGNSEASYTYTSNGVSETNMGYLSNLPMFGVAQEHATYGVEVPNMKYTTGILGVTLDNVQSKATWLKVEAGNGENIAGSFEVELKDNAVLKEAAAGDVIKTPSNIIYVNLENAPRTRAIVYLPIIAQDYTDLDVSFSASAATDPTTIGAWTSIAKFADSSVTPAVTKTVARTEFLEVYYDFPLDTHTPEALTEVLSARTAVTGTVNLDIDYLRFSKDDTDSPDAQWYTIKVPNMAADEVHIKMPNGIDNNTKNRSKLVIADADATDPYTGKIIFDLSDGANAASVNNGSSTSLAIDVNLLNADVELVGDYATTNLDIKNAKSLKFGDGTVATTVNGNVTTNQAASGYVSTIKESITVAANATLGQPFTIVGANTGKNAAFNVTVEGSTKAFVARYSDVTVQGDGQIGGTLYAFGNVTVESSQNNAITTLHYAGNGKTLNLKKGGISVIKTIDYTSGTPAVPSTLNKLTITNVETGKSQIGDIQDYQTISATNTHVLDVTFEKSVWFGEATTSTSMKNPAKIYTASQFASLSTTDAPSAGYKLMTNIDLNDKAWAGVSIDKSFDGNNKTIEKVNVTGTGAVSGGLFTNVTFGDNVEIKNLTVKNIYTTGLVASTGATPAYPTIIGALVATANVNAATSSKAKITNVKIDAADKELGTAYVATEYVGGLIGKVTGTGYLNIAGASASNKGTVALNKIKGHAYLGGLIGGMDGAAYIDIKNYTVTLSDGFTVNKPATIDSDYTYPEYGTVGMYIGQANGTIQYDAANASDKIINEREVLGFKYNHFTTTTTPQILHRFYGGNANIGYSPNITALTVGSTSATAVTTQYLTKTAYNALAAAAKLNPNIYIKSSEYPED